MVSAVVFVDKHNRLRSNIKPESQKRGFEDLLGLGETITELDMKYRELKRLDTGYPASEKVGRRLLDVFDAGISVLDEKMRSCRDNHDEVGEASARDERNVLALRRRILEEKLCLSGDYDPLSLSPWMVALIRQWIREREGVRSRKDDADE